MAINSSGARAAAVRTPAWLVPVYLVGLVCVYVGERIIVTDDGFSLIFSASGLLLVAATTCMRFLPVFRAGKQLAAVERVLGLASVVGLLGAVLGFAASHGGGVVLGLDELSSAERLSSQGMLGVCWVVALLCGVLPLVFGEASLLPMRSASRVEARRVQSAAISGLSLALALSYCGLFVYAASKTGAAADYSYFKTSEPGGATKRMIESFDEPLTITGFFPDVSEVRPEVVHYFEDLCQGVPNVEWKIVDRYLEPKLATELKVFSDGTVVFKKGETRQSLTVGSDLKVARAKLKTLDRDVQEQLQKLLRARRVVYMTTGHGELNAPPPGDKEKGRGADIVETLVRKQNFQVRTLGLAQGLGREVPEDAAVVFVLGPQQPFSKEEVESLRRYAEGGGRVFLALDAGALEDESDVLGDAAGADAQQPTPAQLGLDALADIVGLNYSSTVLANPSHHIRRRSNDSDRALLVSNRFSSHASVSTLSRNSARAAILFARTGSLSSQAKPGLKVDRSLRAMSGTFADLNGNYRLDKDTEKADDHLLIAAVSKASKPASPHAPAGVNTEQAQEMRAFVLADADAVSDLLMSNFPPNRLLVMDAVRWLAGDESFVGEINNEEDVRIEHTKQKDLAWFYGTIVGAPLLVLMVGLAWARRSRRSERVVA